MPGGRGWRAARLGSARLGSAAMAGGGPGAARWGRRRSTAAMAAAAALSLALALACLLLLRGALLGAAALGAAGAWCAMRPGPLAPRPLGKTAANGNPAATSGRPVRAPPRRFGLGASPATPRCPPQGPRRRYPLPQALSTVPVVLPAARWETSCSPRSAAWLRRTGPIRSPVTVRIARPAASMARSPALEQLMSPIASPANSSLDPCAKETVLNAIKESRKRAVEREEEEEEDQAFGNNQESKRRRHDSSGSAQSAFEPLVANGAPTSLIPKPGSLKRSLVCHYPDDCSNKRSCTSSTSSLNHSYTGGIPSSIRNAIASSYSSSQGLAQLRKRSDVSVSPLSSPASSRSQTPEWPRKKPREEESHRSNTSTPVKSDKELQTEKVVETPVRKKRNSLSPASGSSGKRKRKIQLLSSRRGDQLALPPPPQLGYSITSEDLDAEKKAAFQWFNKVLEDKADVIPSTTADSTPVSRPLAFTVTAPGPMPALTAPAPATTDSFLDSLKKMQSSQAVPASADSTGTAVVSQLPPSAAQPPAPAVSQESGSLPATSADIKPVPVLSTAAPAAPAALGLQAPSSLAPSAFTELGETPSKPPAFPKPSILFGMPNTPPASQPATTTATAAPTTATAAPTTATAVPSTTPLFKPIFGALPKSESAAPSTAVVSATVTVSSGPSSTSTPMFKPIFGSVTTASSPVKVSPFAFKPMSQPASATDLPAASTTTLAGFTGLPNVIFTTAATTSTTQSSSTDATIKPVFSFGLNPPASTGPTTITAATSTSMSQPFLFGGPTSSATTTESSFATPAPVFQFGKPPAATVTATTSVPGGPAFGQASSNSTAPTTTVGFSIFGATTLTTSTPATTGQATLTFGSSISAFGSSFSTSTKAPPPYPSAATQPAFSTGAAESQPPASKPAAGPVTFGPPFSFGAPAAQSITQPTFGGSAQPAFGTSSTQGSFGTSSTQAAFGTTTSVFSFGTATSTTASFGSTTQTTSSSAGTAVFGTTPSPFTFGATAQPGPSGSAFGIGTPALGSASPAVAFSFGAGQSGASPAATPFGSSLAQSTLGAQNQSTPFAFAVPSTPNNKPAFGATPTPTFGQSTPVPGAVGSGSSSLSFGTPSTPASGFGGVGTSFGSSTPTFSIGSGSKMGTRQRLQARRQHTRKK
ncbi:nuclear envelope pore membrane protein POM 121 [Indicator indicator]|uniref:nuclear envelope pore membrane protein POM 121 n=1 Tax=Indicator indicator TaxID=1002788 RepID=UPI0023DECE7C|nr:nuclear envelope pore membrane protein POM 121 [Indicator indicator]